MGLDFDNLLAYSTIKVVKIRDRRLGFIHYGFIFGIFLYVLIYVLLVQKRYLKIEVPVGTTRASLGTHANFTVSFNQSYCTNNNSTETLGFVHNCVFLDAIDTQYPATEATTLFATSRLTLSVQQANTSIPGYVKWEDTQNKTTLFVTNFEEYTVKLDHTVNAVKLGLQRNAVNMPGTLKDSYGKDVALSAPDQFGVSGQSDILQLGTLLRLSGVTNFSAMADTSKPTAPESYRYAGVVLLMLIYYDNKYSFNTDNVQYSLEIKRVENTEFKVEEPTYAINEATANRIIRNRHGIRILLLQTGQLGRFDFGVFLVEVISAMGLLAVATAAVDFLALMVMPEKKAYEEYKIQNVNPNQTPPANQVLIY